MVELSSNAKTIAESRYFGEGENWEKLSHRVGSSIAQNEKDRDVWTNIFAEEIYDMNFIPAGRILRNAGKLRQSILNCATLPIEDSIESIGETLKNALILWSYGAGIGINFSPLREKGRPLMSKGGYSSGLVSFLKAFDDIACTIETGGSRRSGCLGLCRISHPEIYEFLDAKRKDGQLSYFNLSVGITKSFLNAVEQDIDWDLTFAGQTVKTVKARDLWDKLMDSNINYGDPGLINMDNLIKNNSYYFQPIIATNLCFSKETRIITKHGHIKIKDLVNKNIPIWDGIEWVNCNNFRVTGSDQKMLKITLYDGSELRVTPYHTMILENGNRIKAEDLIIGDKLETSTSDLIYGSKQADGAYLKGFLTGDGHIKKNRNHPCLTLYSTKYICEDRLISSALQLPIISNNTNVVSKIEFNKEVNNRKGMRGLVCRNDNLYKWASEYKTYIPDEVFLWDRDSVCNFIAGVMDADGTSLNGDTGIGYQICSIHKQWLLDFQTLLKSIGVYSKVSVNKEESVNDFNDGYGEYKSNKIYRLSMSGQQAINLAMLIKFERLEDFSNHSMEYNIKPKYNKIVNIEEDGIDEKVYCCTINSTHKLAISLGIQTGQCSEIPLPAYGMCALTCLVLPKFLSGKNTNWKKLETSVYNVVRFLDNVVDVNFYPIKQTELVAKDSRRIGMGIMGLHDYLMNKGIRYGSDKSLIEIERLFKFLRDTAYRASINLAVEKGAFPKFSKTDYGNASFVRKLPAKIRIEIKEYGIRNTCLLSGQPSGTTSLLADVSSGIEPVFSLAYKRKDRISERYYVHPKLIEFLESGEKEKPGWLVDVSDLSPEDHLEVQSCCQKFIDNSISKTINCPEGTTKDNLSKLVLEYISDLKGIAIYVDGSKQGQILNKVDIDDIRKNMREGKVVSFQTEDDVQCKSGSCDI
jgi:ribonucleoside-diphosphate reductase alpha chain